MPLKLWCKERTVDIIKAYTAVVSVSAGAAILRRSSLQEEDIHLWRESAL